MIGQNTKYKIVEVFTEIFEFFVMWHVRFVSWRSDKKATILSHYHEANSELENRFLAV